MKAKIMYKGIPASPGIVIGRARISQHIDLDLYGQQVKSSRKSLLEEKACLESSFEKARRDLEDLREATFRQQGETYALIFDAHLLLLDDPEMKIQVLNRIENENADAAYALASVASGYVSTFKSMSDPYMSERADDIRDVFTRVLKYILGIDTKNNISHEENSVWVSRELSPSDIAALDKTKVIGIVTEAGGGTSHAAIMARNMEIPAVVGLSGILGQISEGDLIILDGSAGDVIVNPKDEIIFSYKEKASRLRLQNSLYRSYVGRSTQTSDGYQVRLGANIGTIDDLDSCEKNDFEEIGLYRSEFLFMERAELPSEEEQYQAYAEVILKLEGKECTIRTLDIGGDKNLDYLSIEKEMNPFLGFRAIRFCLERKDIFKTQLRAILRASVHGNVRIMFPMVSSLDELLNAKEILKICQNELDREGLQWREGIEIGVMIEVPSAALIADIFAKHVNFFSLGTNDLLQYTCAVDRMNPKVSHLYEPLHPGLLRLIDLVARHAKSAGIKLGMCGSMAHIPELVPLFIGMGFDSLSMSALHILPTRKIISELNLHECKKKLKKVLILETASEIRKFLGANESELYGNV